MSTRFAEGIKAVQKLSLEQQEIAGEVLLTIARQAESGVRLTKAQTAEVELALEEADRGDFASDAEMEAVWRVPR